jgi:hypothetical protein
MVNPPFLHIYNPKHSLEDGQKERDGKREANVG